MTLGVHPLAPSLWMWAYIYIFFLIGFGMRDSERGEGGMFRRGWAKGPVTIHILIIWRLHLLLRGRHDSFTIAGAVAFLQHAWPSCLNNTGSVLRHHAAVKYWLNTRVWPERQEFFRRHFDTFENNLKARKPRSHVTCDSERIVLIYKKKIFSINKKKNQFESDYS